jgi:hypothetical protein
MKVHLPSRILAVSLFSLALVPLALHAEPQWIWSQKQGVNNEDEVFRKTFTVSGEIKSATLTVTCDNSAVAKLNGEQVLRNRDWKLPERADVSKKLKAGLNELVVEGHNNEGSAALLVSLAIETADGKKQLIETGPDWETAKPKTTEFKPVVVIAKYGDGPWGNVLTAEPGKKGGVSPRASTAAAAQTVADPSTLQLLPGFKAELLYTVPKQE